MEEAQNHLENPPDVSEHRRAAVHIWVEMTSVYIKAKQKLEKQLGQIGLTEPQCDVLAQLHKGEGITQQELAAKLLVTKGNVCGILDRMETAGLLERRPDPVDKRANRLYMTPFGKGLFAEVLPQIHETLGKILDCLELEEIKSLSRMLDTIQQANK